MLIGCSISGQYDDDRMLQQPDESHWRNPLFKPKTTSGAAGLIRIPLARRGSREVGAMLHWRPPRFTSKKSVESVKLDTVVPTMMTVAS